MGRIKTKLIKNISKSVFRDNSQDFTADFDQNKKLVEKFADLPSKKMRNVVAGAITRMKKTEQ